MPKLAFTVLTWNLQNFGSYTGGIEVMAKTIIKAKADIVLIEEMIVNRSKGKGLKIVKTGEFPPLPQGINLARQLLFALNFKDSKGKWKMKNTNASCANADRDAYVFFYRSTPSKSTNVLTLSGEVVPNSITVTEWGIYQDGPTDPSTSKKRKITFQGSRRPGGALFTLTSGSTTKTCMIFAFHALAPDNSINKIRHSIEDAITVAGAATASQSADSFIIGGDFNLDYDSNDNFYNNLSFNNLDGDGDQTINVAIQADGQSSLRTTVDISTNEYKTNHAYDNLLYFGDIDILDGSTPHIIDVIENNANSLQSQDATMTDAAAITTAFQVYRTGSGGQVSDHLPAVGSFVM